MNMHKNAKLTPLGRERMVKMMLDGQTPAKAAAVAGVCPGTARKWLMRSPAGMQGYVHDDPGDMIHLDIKRLGRFVRAGHRS